MEDLKDIVHNVWRDEFSEHVNIIIRLLQRLNDRFRVLVGAVNDTLRLNGRDVRNPFHFRIEVIN